MRELTCIARGREGQWEAICLDFNIAVSGNSFEQVRETLSEAITYYIQDAMQEDERTREQLLNRRVPFWSRLQWTLPVIVTAVLARHPKDAAATNSFFVPCPA